MNKDDFPQFTRPSKLKRRRRTPTTDNPSTAALESRPLKRFAADPVAKNALLSGTTTTAVANDDIARSLDTNTGGAAANVSLFTPALASISTILNLDSLTNHFTRGGEKEKKKKSNQNQNLILSSAKMVAAQIDYYISASCQYAISGKNNRHHHERQNLYSVGNVVHYPTLGVIQLHKDQDEEKESPLTSLKNATKDFCTISFPQLRTRYCIDSSRIRKILSFQSGDGAAVDLNLMTLPRISSCLNNTINTEKKSLKYIKIITKHGATIQQHYDIDKMRRNGSFSSSGSSSYSSSSSTTTTTSSDIIGKLMFGAIRPVMECKWLEEPTASLYANMEVEEELVGVMRYKICLLPSDIIISNHNSDATVHDDCNVNKEKMHGWISDRSRLKSQPYTIAQVIE